MVVRILVVAVAGSFLYGCGAVGGQEAAGSNGGGTNGGGGKASLPEGPPGIVGVVTEVRRDPGKEAKSLATILVEESPGQGKPVGCSKDSVGKGCHKLLLDISKETSVLREMSGDGELVRATEADLENGQRLRAWHDKRVTKSYPGQTSARVVVIEEAD